ncbi:MAG TPA: response regulator transcription factor [Candidatus Acidoferrales bacterium]|jgi:DNA-binding NarL/FixJ family response regulator|nr:response regulator transcription factor [Candidatus Acidoferrales bacterium]
MTASPQFRILVVDDHEFIRRGVCGIFTAETGFDICGEAANGQQAVEQVKKLHPHLVILDISMPVMNGLEAAAEIRRIAPQTKIIILTMHDSQVMKDQAQKAGADAYVVKTEIAEHLVRQARFLLNLMTAD